MVGIVSFGGYVPFNRLDRRRITEATGDPAAPGEKAVANFDEDSVSMAVEASLDCLSGFSAGDVMNVYFSSTTAPNREKQSASTVAAALNTPATPEPWTLPEACGRVRSDAGRI